MSDLLDEIGKVYDKILKIDKNEMMNEIIRAESKTCEQLYNNDILITNQYLQNYFKNIRLDNKKMSEMIRAPRAPAGGEQEAQANE